MRYLPLALLLICATASATPTSDKPLETGKPVAQVTENADQKYIESAIKSSGSREAAARIEISRGWKQLKQGDLEVAVQNFTMAYKLDPKNMEVYWGLGNAMTQQGRYAAATTYYERATKIDPQNPKLMADIGLSQTYSAYKSTTDLEKQKERIQQAMQWFDSAEKIDPNRAVIYANRAIALYITKDYAGAWKNVEKAESLDRNSVDKRFLADLTGKQARPATQKAPTGENGAAVKTQAVTTPVPVQNGTAKSAAPAPLPTTKLSPQIRDETTVKDASATAPAAKAAPAATAKTPAPAATPAKPVEAAPAQPATAKPEAAQGAETKQKRMDLNQGKTYPEIGNDKRDCLKLKTNEEIIRCVYPQKK